MTDDMKTAGFSQPTQGQSPLLPFAENDMLAVRLLPAEFARAVGVSKQSVSRWIRDNKVTLGCDGRVNPNQAMAQLLRNGDPGRIRARMIKQAVASVGDLRVEAARAGDLEQKLADAIKRLEYLEGYAKELDETFAALPAVAFKYRHQLRRDDADAFIKSFAEVLDIALMQAADSLGNVAELIGGDTT